MRSCSMNKFTKIKKALAVSVCSSMLFSGASKILAMNGSFNCSSTSGNNKTSNYNCNFEINNNNLTYNATKTILSNLLIIATKKLCEFYEVEGTSLRYELGVQTLCWFVGSFVSEVFFRCVDSCYEKRSVNYCANEVKELYNKTCYLLTVLSDKNLLKKLTDNQSDKSNNEIKTDKSNDEIKSNNNGLERNLFLSEISVGIAIKNEFSYCGYINPLHITMYDKRSGNIATSKKELAIKLADVLHQTVDFEELGKLINKKGDKKINKNRLIVLIDEARKTEEPKTEFPEYYLEDAVNSIMKLLNIDKIDNNAKKFIDEKRGIFESEEVLDSMAKGMSNNILIGDDNEK